LTTQVIASGEFVRIHGMILSGAGTFNFLNTAGTALFNITLAAGGASAISSSIAWLADAGLKVTVPSGGECIIYHSNTGT
jgi:hypothetical protein